jgi:hypothetical protein
LAAVAAAATSTACLAALVAVVVEPLIPEETLPVPAGLELLAKVTLAAMAPTLLATLSATVAVVAVRVLLVKTPVLISVAVALVAQVLLTLSVQALLRHMLVAAVDTRLLLATQWVVLALVVMAVMVRLIQPLVWRTQAPVAAVLLQTKGRMAAQVAQVSWWSATASRNFSTGETHETIDSGHSRGTDLDGLCHKPRRLLQRHRCA